MLEGPPLDDAALACLAEALRGREELAAPGGGAPFLASDDGVVDYPMALAHGP